jgi:hypothetical protein
MCAHDQTFLKSCQNFKFTAKGIFSILWYYQKNSIFPFKAKVWPLGHGIMEHAMLCFQKVRWKFFLGWLKHYVTSLPTLIYFSVGFFLVNKNIYSWIPGKVERLN